MEPLGFAALALQEAFHKQRTFAPAAAVGLAVRGIQPEAQKSVIRQLQGETVQ